MPACSSCLVTIMVNIEHMLCAKFLSILHVLVHLIITKQSRGFLNYSCHHVIEEKTEARREVRLLARGHIASNLDARARTPVP